MRTVRAIDGALDAWRDPRAEVRVAVEHWYWHEPVGRQFIERPKDVRMVWHYLRRVGPVAVWRKIRSRLDERRRNDKVVGIGVGCLLDVPADVGLVPGQQVVFLAPNHSTAWPNISLDFRFVVPLEPIMASRAMDGRGKVPDEVRMYAGWSPYSGRSLDHGALRRVLQTFASDVAGHPGAAVSNQTTCTARHRRTERREVPTRADARPTAVVFGLGNYAKTQVVPVVRRHLHLVAIHEIDPDQLDSASVVGVTLDTSPWPRPSERYDAWFIAGFHHTHGPLAIQALGSGAYTVVEKPVVTNREQFAKLHDALTRSGGRRLFACFHKRYSQLHQWAMRDLEVAPGSGKPIDMHCLVYEIPLPALHWYNWPTSGSRLISNGCHWLDYFLYVNDFTPVRTLAVLPLRGRDLLVTVRLENDAQLTMSLTDTGSQRLGVRDVIELRADDVTVRVTDATYYDAESTRRALPRHRVNPMQAYTRMYESICQRIVAGESGDIVDSLRSTTLMLDLEDELKRLGMTTT